MLNIIKGHINELLNKEFELYSERIKICDQCELESNTRIGKICDHRKCISGSKVYNIKNKSSESICGCGCRLDAKLRLFDEKCILNKW